MTYEEVVALKATLLSEMRDPLAVRVAARWMAATNPVIEQTLDRIEKIPGWQRSNFLQSVYDQARRGRVPSPKQIAVVEKIEAEQGGRGGGGGGGGPPRGAIPFGLKPYGHDKQEVQQVLNALREHGAAKVYDPKGILGTNRKLQEYLVQEMAADFWGQAEGYAERNADEDDPQRHDLNARGREAAEGAAQEMDDAKIQIKVDGQTTIVTVKPSPADLRRKYRLD